MNNLNTYLSHYYELNAQENDTLAFSTDSNCEKKFILEVEGPPAHVICPLMWLRNQFLLFSSMKK